MNLKELIEKACEESPRFKEKYFWILHQKKKVPEWDWLMDQLETALGHAFMKENAEAEIEKAKGE